MYKCHFCEEPTVDLSKGYKYENGAYFHLDCYEAFKERQFFYDTVKEVFKLRAPGPRIIATSDRFHKEKKYTYYGMAMTLKYIYQVRKVKDKFDIQNKTIGLIPYYYLEAAQYWAEETEKKRRLEEMAHTTLQEKNEAPAILGKKERKRKLTYSLEDDENGD